MKKLLLIGIMIITLAFCVSANPLLDSITNKTIDEGQSLNFQVTASAADSGNSVFNIIPAAWPLPSWISYTQTSGTAMNVDLAPGYTDAGVYEFTFEVADGDSSDQQAVKITINDVAAITTGLTITDVTIGDDNQVRSNPDADDEDDENVYDDSKTVTIENTGTSDITNIYLTTVGVDTKYNVTFDETFPITLAAGASKSIKVIGRIPGDLASYSLDMTDMDDRKIEIGSLKVTGVSSGQNLEKTSKLYMEAENQLEIDEIEVYVNGEKADTITSDGNDIDDIVPGDEIELIIFLNNNFDDNDPEDLDIEDVTVSVEIDDGDLDVSEEEDSDDINPDSSEQVSITFEVDQDIDDDDYDMIIEAIGTDNNDEGSGAVHGDRWEIKFNVNRESHEIRIIDVNAPEELSCFDTTIDLLVEIRNVGKNDEDEGALKVSSSDFNFNQRESDIEIDRDDEDDFTFTIPVAEGITPGRKFITIETFYDRTKSAGDARTIQVIVPECTINDDEDEDTVVDDDEEEEDDTQVIYVNQSSNTGADDGLIIASDVSSSTETPFSSNLFVMLLIIAVVIAIGSMVAVVLLLVKMGKK